MTRRTYEFVAGNGSPLTAQKINPNDPCPCGSGKKAKKCHGTETKYFYSKPNPSKEDFVEKALKERPRLNW